MIHPLETGPARDDERCSRHACSHRARLRFGGKPYCAPHFCRAFDRAAMDAKIQALIDLVRANGYVDITWLGDASLAQLAEATT